MNKLYLYKHNFRLREILLWRVHCI